LIKIKTKPEAGPTMLFRPHAPECKSKPSLMTTTPEAAGVLRDHSAQLMSPGGYQALVSQLGAFPDDFPFPLYVVDPGGRLVFCNHALAQLVGERIGDLLGKPSLILYPPDTVASVLAQRLHALIGDAAPNNHMRTRMRCSGGTLPVDVSVSRLEEQGKCAGFLVLVGQAGEAKARPIVEYLLQLSAEEADALPHGLIVLDRSGIVIAYNGFESRLSGLARNRVLGRNFFLDIAPCTRVQKFAGLYRQMVETGEPADSRFDFLFRFSRGDQPVSIRMAYSRRLEQGAILVEPQPRPA
jgi:photoactive yellow protein